LEYERPLPFLPETGSADGGGSEPDPLRLSASGSGDWLELDARALPFRDDRRWLLALDGERYTHKHKHPLHSAAADHTEMFIWVRNFYSALSLRTHLA